MILRGAPRGLQPSLLSLPSRARSGRTRWAVQITLRLYGGASQAVIRFITLRRLFGSVPFHGKDVADHLFAENNVVFLRGFQLRNIFRECITISLRLVIVDQTAGSTW